MIMNYKVLNNEYYIGLDTFISEVGFDGRSLHHGKIHCLSS